jgi:hypothetical protein
VSLPSEVAVALQSAPGDELDPTACDPALAARLRRFGRMLRATPEVRGGLPVLARDGSAFAVAWGDATVAVLGPGGWQARDAYPDDVTFRRGDDALLDALRAGWAAAGASGG